MTIKQAIVALITILLSLTIISCDTTEVETSKVIQNNKIAIQKDEFKQICDSSNNLVLKLYKHGSDSSNVEELTKLVWQDSIIDLKRIESFRILFKSIENGGYCCCARNHYTVTFYRDKYKLDTYQIDTSEIKDNITLFSNGFQHSYIIPLKDFNSFIRKK
jgi:hypothetical protein